MSVLVPFTPVIVSNIANSHLTKEEFTIVVVSFLIFIGVWLLVYGVGFLIEKIKDQVNTNRKIAYRIANQCKGMTKKGERCLNWSDCPHHIN
jgi:predicted permease